MDIERLKTAVKDWHSNDYSPTFESMETLVKCSEAVIDASESIDLEKMAEIEHIRWSGWQEYLHSKCIKNEDGSLTIPSGYVSNLVRLINTPYEQLTEQEKESDKTEAKNSIAQAALVIAKNYRKVSELPKLNEIVDLIYPSDKCIPGNIIEVDIYELAKLIYKMIGGE
jgi:hypothetical protein